jgi:hypothetical protein
VPDTSNGGGGGRVSGAEQRLQRDMTHAWHRTGEVEGGRWLASGASASVAVDCNGPLLWARPATKSSNFLYSSWFSTDLNFYRPIGGLPKLEKFQIKYGFEVFEIKNNFSYKNFSRFEKNVELKFEEAPMVLKSM